MGFFSGLKKAFGGIAKGVGGLVKGVGGVVKKSLPAIGAVASFIPGVGQVVGGAVSALGGVLNGGTGQVPAIGAAPVLHVPGIAGGGPTMHFGPAGLSANGIAAQTPEGKRALSAPIMMMGGALLFLLLNKR